MSNRRRRSARHQYTCPRCAHKTSSLYPHLVRVHALSLDNQTPRSAGETCAFVSRKLGLKQYKRERAS
ncbi:MAG: hypothetical protein IPH13_20275 [Planctomycetes bacterium]|nr:hypothetical protein [Planctomycetota bacterium]